MGSSPTPTTFKYKRLWRNGRRATGPEKYHSMPNVMHLVRLRRSTKSVAGSNPASLTFELKDDYGHQF